MKIIYNNIIPPKGFKYINLFGILFSRKKYKGKVNPIDMNHESIHTKQMLELLIIPFYIWYFIEWLIKLIYYTFSSSKFHDAYRNISFEREAYNNQNDLDYLKNRKHYNWLKLIYEK